MTVTTGAPGDIWSFEFHLLIEFLFFSIAFLMYVISSNVATLRGKK